MPDTGEALLILAAVVAPGFIAFYVAREISPFPPAKLSDGELLLMSLSFATAALAVEAGLWSALVWLWRDLPVLAGVTVDEFGRLGYWAALVASPQRVVPIAVLQFVIHCALLVAFGIWDPAGRFVEERRRGIGFSAADPWTSALEGLRVSKGRDAAFVRAVMASGDVYYGYFSKMSNQPRDDGSRDLILQAISWAANRTDVATPLHAERPEDTALALNTKDVRAVEILFADLT